MALRQKKKKDIPLKVKFKHTIFSGLFFSPLLASFKDFLENMKLIINLSTMIYARVIYTYFLIPQAHLP